MAGSLKVITTVGQKALTYGSVPLPTLNDAPAWTISFFYQLQSWDAGLFVNLLQIGSVVNFSITGGNVHLTVRNAGNTASVSTSFAADVNGHHVCISGSIAGTSTIYIDGIQNTTMSPMGHLEAAANTMYLGPDDPDHAITLYLRDLAIWGLYSASSSDALDLATGVHTPATLATPATNYWTLQGTAGDSPAFPPGLATSLGSIDLNSFFGGGTLVYDAHPITANPAVAVFLMTPYVDATGYLLVIPLYLNPAITAGGPVPPFNTMSVTTDPTITVAGSPVARTVLPHDVLCSMIVYQFASPVTAGQTVTMSAITGWASTSSGIVGGTSDAGLGSAPLAVTNYAGQDRDSEPVSARTYKNAWDIWFSNAPNLPGFVVGNIARRIGSLDPGYLADNGWRGEGTVTSFDANNLPASFTGAFVWGFITGIAANNGCDGKGIPALYGTLTLIYGDATPGVTSNPSTGHVLDLNLVSINPDWTVSLLDVVNPGDWDAAWNSGAGAWHHITRTYSLSWSPAGGVMDPGIMLQIARVGGSGGPVVIPILANGMSELGVFEPDVDDPSVPATIDYTAMFDPMAVSPSWLRRHAGAHALRWMPNQLTVTTTGSGTIIYPEDLDIRPTSHYLVTDVVTTTLDVTRVDPISTSVPTPVVIDYLPGVPTGSIPLTLTPTRGIVAFVLVTTSAPHGIRTGDRFQINAPAAMYLTVAMDAVQTVISLSSVAGITTGTVLKIDASGADLLELVRVTSISGLDVTVIRATRGTTASAKPYQTGVTLQIRSMVAEPAFITLTAGINATETVLHVSITQNINGDSESYITAGSLFQLGSASTDEQVEVLSLDNALLTLTVQRGASGTVPLSKSSGTVVYPCPGIGYGGLNNVFMAVSSTQLLLALPHRAIPRTASRIQTLLSAQTYAHSACPLFTKRVPPTQGTSTYEMCAHATALVAAANPDGKCICWVCVPFMITDAGVTEIVTRMMPDFVATPGLDLIIQCSNEMFNGGFDQGVLAAYLANAAPNPQTTGTGFADWYDWTASRQHQITLTARAAFTANGLDPDRVVWLQAGGSTGVVQEVIAFCQTWSLPIRSFICGFYADMYPSNLSDTYVSWIPQSTGVAGATALWDLATARAVMMSNYRASFRYGAAGPVITNVSQAQYLSRYNHGLDVHDGVTIANANSFEGNPVRGLLCGYEGATTAIIPWPFPLIDPGDQDHSIFPQTGAWCIAMQYDPKWYHTEIAFLEACQEGSYRYALLMGDKFPDPEDAKMEFGCYFVGVGVSIPMGSTSGYMYAVYRWQQQQPGYGVVNNLDFWDPTTPVSHDMTPQGGSLPPLINESVRGQAILDWSGSITPTPTPTPTPTLSSIVVTPANPSIVAGSTQQFTAIGHYSDSSVQNLTGSAVWASSGTAVATISAGGLATAIGSGMTTISATSSSITGSTVLTVSVPMPASSFVAPGKATVNLPAGPDPAEAKVVMR